MLQLLAAQVAGPRTPAREGLEECFTVNRLGISPSLHRCLATKNLIESPQSGVRMRTRRVCRWRDAVMVERWAASAFLGIVLVSSPGLLPQLTSNLLSVSSWVLGQT